MSKDKISLVIDSSKAKLLYKNADTSLKTILEETFGKEFFSEKLIDRINTIEDVYKELNRKQPILSDYKFLPVEKREKAMCNQYAEDISEVFAEGLKFDFTNLNQRKYYNWYEKKQNSWVLDSVLYGCLCSVFVSGFYFKDEETAKHCANKFLDSVYSKVLEPLG